MEAPTEMAMTSSKKGTFQGGVGTWGRAYGRAGGVWGGSVASYPTRRAREVNLK